MIKEKLSRIYQTIFKMRLSFIQKNKSKLISKKEIQKHLLFFKKELIAQGIEKNKLNQKILIVFTSSQEMRQLNRDHLKRDYATDILSFSPVEEDSLGELILSVEKIKSQAKEHGISFKEEMMYLILHGLLHLLGYQHEKGGRKTKEMYRIQDSLFETWQKQI